MKHFFTAFAISMLLFVSFGCTSKKKRVEISDSRIEEIHKSPKAIKDIADISKDTIIACKYDPGIIMTVDGGKSWIDIDTTCFCNEITKTNEGLIVGLYRWIGIHEKDRAVFFILKMNDKVCKFVELDTKKFFPYHIVSNPNEQLRIQTVDNKIFKLTGNDFQNDWTFVEKRQVPDFLTGNWRLDPGFDINEQNGVKLIKHRGNKADTLAELSTFSSAEYIIRLKNIVHISGSFGDYLDGHCYSGRYAQYNIKSKRLREFKIPGYYAMLKSTQLGNVYIFNSDGVFIEDEDSIKRIL
jgi:hypothetical protein